MKLRSLTIDDLTIDDERSYRHIALYGDLKRVLRRDGYRFRVPDRDTGWDRVTFLNLTFWSPEEAGDLLVSDHLAADVVCHVAWHHLADRALRGDAADTTCDALLLGESIASAFDLYLIGRLLGHAPDAEILETQVPAMADAAEAAGLPQAAFESLLGEVAAEPERAFEDLRALLFDVTTSLVRCDTLARAAEVLSGFEGRRFAPLLHHYELSTWILGVRARAAAGGPSGAALAPDPATRAVDAALRNAKVALDWLEEHWVRVEVAPAAART